MLRSQRILFPSHPKRSQLTWASVEEKTLIVTLPACIVGMINVKNARSVGLGQLLWNGYVHWGSDEHKQDQETGM